MPQVLGLVFLGAGLIAGYKALQAAANRVSEQMRASAATARQNDADRVGEKNLGTLEFDPVTGVYRPRAS